MKLPFIPFLLALSFACGAASFTARSEAAPRPKQTPMTARQVDARVTKLLNETSSGKQVGDEVGSSAEWELEQLLSKELARPDLFGAEFTELVMAHSPDKRLNIYSWQVANPSSINIYAAFAQYKKPDGTVGVAALARAGDDTAGDTGQVSLTYLYDQITAMKQSDGNTVYVAVGSAPSNNNYSAGSVSAFCITNRGLEPASIFQTPKESLREIHWIYMQDTAVKPKFEQAGKVLEIPIIKEDEFAKSYLTYVFNGSKYVFRR